MADLESVVREALAQLGRDYFAARADEVRRLHNRIAEVIAEEKPSPPNALLALEMARQEVLEQCLTVFLAEGPTEDAAAG